MFDIYLRILKEKYLDFVSILDCLLPSRMSVDLFTHEVVITELFSTSYVPGTVLIISIWISSFGAHSHLRKLDVTTTLLPHFTFGDNEAGKRSNLPKVTQPYGRAISSKTCLCCCFLTQQTKLSDGCVSNKNHLNDERQLEVNILARNLTSVLQTCVSDDSN